MITIGLNVTDIEWYLLGYLEMLRGLVHIIPDLKLNSGANSENSKLRLSFSNIHSIEKGSNLNFSIDYLSINPGVPGLPFSVDIFIIAEEDFIYVNVRVKIFVPNEN